jgi:LuxR family transcriptional regulator, maltose regulon positive regulatory protein
MKAAQTHSRSVVPHAPAAPRRRPHAPDPSRRTPPNELLEAKLAPPEARPGSVSRPGLVNRLRAAAGCPVVAVSAPLGYGKSTVLAQWADRDERPFAWATLDDGDNDALTLLRCVAAALDRIEPLDQDVQAALDRARTSVWRSAAPRLCAALAARSEPFVLVLDEVQAIHASDAARTLAQLAKHMPAGSALVLSGRLLPELPLARLRAEGRLFELGAADLAFSRREANLLLRGAGVVLEEPAVVELTDRTEGWPAGLYLAALSILAGGTPEEFGGADRFVRDYVRLELLDDLTAEDLHFLTCSAELEALSGPLCDAALGTTGSAAVLEDLEARSLFVIPLDRSRDGFRYQRLFRGVLRAELSRREPELALQVHRRAADWCEANGEFEDALGYAAAAGDDDGVARLIGSLALPAYHEGRILTTERWFDLLDASGPLDRYPAVAVLGAWTHAVRGRPEAAEGWLEAAERGSFEGHLPDGTHAIAPWLSLLRAALAARGAEAMLADAEEAERGLAPQSQWRPAALLLRGVAQLLLEGAAADGTLAEAADAARRVGATDTRIVALSEGSLLAAAQGRHDDALALALEARELVDGERLADYATSALQLAASARAELLRGNSERARLDLDAADQLRSQLTYALPWYSVQALLELAQAHAGLLNLPEACSLLADAEAVLRRRPGLGVLPVRAKALRKELRALLHGPSARESMLTPAELRLVPLLATHMSFREIGEQLHVSRNTVKTQAIAVYRKLGVSSRSDAIERAASLGLVQSAVAVGALSPLQGDAPVA